MTTPAALSRALAERPASPGLAQAVAALRERYVAGVPGAPAAMRSDLDREAYLQVRMPATSAAVASALRYCDTRGVHSLLDLGCGPGSALWAAVERCGIERITAIDGDADLLELGRGLGSGNPGLACTTWIQADLRHLPDLNPHDLVILSYALNEVSAAEADTIIDHAWAACRSSLLLIEPGSRAGASIVRRARERLIAAGAHVRAPCTHHEICPLAGDSWCHFPVRLARSRIHRQAKGGSRNWEDEPFAFILVQRSETVRGGGRIIGHPRQVASAIELDCCSAQGFSTQSVERREEAFRRARRASWGDHWDMTEAG